MTHEISGEELYFEVTQEADGGYWALCAGEPDIATEADTWDALCDNLREAVAAYYFDSPAPRTLHLHLERDVVLKVA